jgi:hypothetical protein
LNLDLFGRLFSSNSLEDIHTTIETIRSGFPTIFGQLNDAGRDEEIETEGEGEDDDVMEHYGDVFDGSNSGGHGDYGDVDRVDALERLVSRFRLLCLTATTIM